ncbi:hypothetical protein OIU79_016497 [Salix purpurea]|uniref:Uncharacterized protein n=1 Tax=Salix purpurea TaxID=77065 RepID=A0A9Q0PEZ5_SALPP|nr:hypothetical protein OIU79_016497 [Salix purpurea]
MLFHVLDHFVHLQYYCCYCSSLSVTLIPRTEVLGVLEYYVWLYGRLIRVWRNKVFVLI